MFNRWFWLALGALFYLNAAAALACNTEICPNDPSAVHFDGSNFVNELTSSGGIYNLPTYTNSIFLSFWVRFTDPSDNFGLMNANYSNHTGGGDDPAVAVAPRALAPGRAPVARLEPLAAEPLDLGHEVA